MGSPDRAVLLLEKQNLQSRALGVLVEFYLSNEMDRMRDVVLPAARARLVQDLGKIETPENMTKYMGDHGITISRSLASKLDVSYMQLGQAYTDVSKYLRKAGVSNTTILMDQLILLAGGVASNTMATNNAINAFMRMIGLDEDHPVYKSLLSAARRFVSDYSSCIKLIDEAVASTEVESQARRGAFSFFRDFVSNNRIRTDGTIDLSRLGEAIGSRYGINPLSVRSQIDGLHIPSFNTQITGINERLTTPSQPDKVKR